MATSSPCFPLSAFRYVPYSYGSRPVNLSNNQLTGKICCDSLIIMSSFILVPSLFLIYDVRVASSSWLILLAHAKLSSCQEWQVSRAGWAWVFDGKEATLVQCSMPSSILINLQTLGSRFYSILILRWIILLPQKSYFSSDFFVQC